LIACRYGLLFPNTWVDAGPDEPMGTTNGNATAAGVIGALAGGEPRLYAVSKTSGVWISVNGGQWMQSQGSPQYAHTIAIDRAYPQLIARGARAGDATDPHLDQCGLWESRNAGDSWTYTYDAYPDTRTQQIYDVAYALSSHTLFLATSIGIGRRPSSDA